MYRVTHIVFRLRKQVDKFLYTWESNVRHTVSDILATDHTTYIFLIVFLSFQESKETAAPENPLKSAQKIRENLDFLAAS